MHTSASHSTSMSNSSLIRTSLYPWWMLVSRSVLFLFCQLLIALILALMGTPSAWNESARWWTFMVTLTNFASMYLLVRVFRAERKRYFDMFRFSRESWKADLLWFVGFTILGIPIAAVMREPLAIAIFGDVMVSTNMLFRPLPTWAFVLSFLFPLTIPFAELPTYFGYAMPRLEVQLKNGWGAWLMASFFLAAQHMFLPLILNGGYLLWRLGMFLPFALFTGLVLKLRPSLLPYFVIIHGLMDVTTVLVYLMI